MGHPVRKNRCRWNRASMLQFGAENLPLDNQICYLYNRRMMLEAGAFDPPTRSGDPPGDALRREPRAAPGVARGHGPGIGPEPIPSGSRPGLPHPALRAAEPGGLKELPGAARALRRSRLIGKDDRFCRGPSTGCGASFDNDRRPALALRSCALRARPAGSSLPGATFREQPPGAARREQPAGSTGGSPARLPEATDPESRDAGTPGEQPTGCRRSQRAGRRHAAAPGTDAGGAPARGS